jgi:hypothetical protein
VCTNECLIEALLSAAGCIYIAALSSSSHHLRAICPHFIRRGPDFEQAGGPESPGLLPASHFLVFGLGELSSATL